MKVASVLLIISVLCFSGCGTSTNNLSEEQSKLDMEQTITADAYLYDAKAYDEGKPRSVRLSFYQTDSALFVSGKGYLGKGALKGEIKKTVSIFYFPTTNEYFKGSLWSLSK